MAKLLKLIRNRSIVLQIILFFLTSFSVAAQTPVTIKGTVIDDRRNETIIGANILIKNAKTNTGVATDLDGQFILTVPSLPATIVVSYIGYRAQEIDIYETPTEPIVISLSEDFNTLNEVVVIGYGTQKRSELTSAIATVSQERLTQVTPNFESVLSGAVAGLNVTQTSGQPGATSTIRIRGGNSINGGNEPLYVIDGFIIYNDPSATNTGAGSPDAKLNPLSFLNTGDIESVEVLKDVSATAIYGTRGANGVIIITTKKGKKGSNRVNYQSTVGWQSIRKKMEFLNAKDWTEYYNDGRIYEGRLGDVKPVPTGAEAQGYDWQDAALRDGFTQDHQISFSGGDDKTRYAISGNYTNQDGIILGTDLKRYAVRINLDRNISEKFRVGVNASGSFTQVNGLSGSGGNDAPNAWVAAIRRQPDVPIYTSTGDFNYENPYATDAKNGISPNPISDLLNVQNLTENTRVLAAFYGEYQILPELKAKVNVGADLNNTQQSNYAPSYTSPGQQNDGVASLGQKRVNTWQAEYTLDYNKVFNEIHSVTVLAGYTTQRTDQKGFSTQVSGFANDATAYNSLQSASTHYLPSSSSITSSLASYLGRVSYSYDERYNLTATIRTDGSSRFVQHWATFPSLGVSWNLDREKFFKFDRVSHLQFRVSGGTVGNQEIGDYRFISNIIPESYYFNDVLVTAFVPENLSNPNLKWETTSQYNAGLNLGLLKDRLNIVFDAYYKKTSDLHFLSTIEAHTGFKKLLENIGSVSNKGVELEIEGKIIERKKFNWRASLNLARNINNVENIGVATELTPSFEGISTLQYLSPLRVEKGQPLGSFYGFEYDGIVQDGDDLSRIPWLSGGNTKEPGQVKYKDQNADGVIDDKDKIFLGNSQPKLTGGFNTSLTYKRVDLFVALQGSYGNKLFNVLSNRLESPTISGGNTFATVANRWREGDPNGNNADATIARSGNSTSIQVDSRFVEDASYLRLRNLSIGYTFPLKGITKDSKLRIFVSAQNILTFTNYSGYDPEANRNGVDESSGLYQGVDFGTYPSSKTFQFGINLAL